MKSIKQIKLMLWMLLGVVAFIGFTSCEEEIVKYHEKKEVIDEPKEEIDPNYVYCNYYYILYVNIEDEEGNDLVYKWCNMSDSQKKCTVTETCNRRNGKDNLEAGGLNPKHFLIRANLAYIYTDDFVVEQFKVFKDDAEDLIFRGKCIDYDWDGKGAIKYTFRGVEIPIKKNVGRTYYNYEDGKYYTDEDYVSPYSEITLVRHDDGTYTLKE